MTTIPTIDDVARAKERIAGQAVRTPLLYSPVLSERLSAGVYLKPESLQRTGSFKFRGAYNALAALPPSERAAGVVAVSSGNHAQGVAEAARIFGVPATIVMPTDAPPMKRRRTERSGARVVDYDRATEDRDVAMARVAAKIGGAFVHPYNDPYVIAGQGTAGLEIAEDFVALGIAPDTVVVPCGGGGLVAGIALAVKDRFPNAEVHTAEPEGFDDYSRSLKAGKPERNARPSGSICDALLSPSPGEIGWAINLKRLSSGLTVSDAEALVGVGYAFDELKLAVEPGGAVSLAALLAGRLETAGRTIVLVLSGGNVGDDMLAAGVAAYRAKP